MTLVYWCIGDVRVGPGKFVISARDRRRAVGKRAAATVRRAKACQTRLHSAVAGRAIVANIGKSLQSPPRLRLQL